MIPPLVDQGKHPNRVNSRKPQKDKWLTADCRAKRRIWEIVCLNFRLIDVTVDVTLVPEWRKPFDGLAERPISEESRGDKTAIELFMLGIRGWEAGLRRQMSDDKGLQQ
ncbi:hypothetical protein [Aeoliella sp.]|uniref:hypothetical protein n=1 Tax=Aeoliella sp. TaxID=2795800 RepID=UPI003CCBC867